MENLRKGTSVHMMSGTIVGIVGIVVTVISIIVTCISIIQTYQKHEHQKSNRSDQS